MLSLLYSFAGVVLVVVMVGLIWVLKPARGTTVAKLGPTAEIAAAITITVGLTLGVLLTASTFLPESATSSAISTPAKKK